MVLQKIYVQYEYQYSGYFLPDAELYVRDSMTGGDQFGEICYSAFDGVSTGCGFNLTEGWTYDVFSGKEGYKTGSDSQLLEFPPPVNPYILLWLYPCEPTVVTHDATEVTATEAKLNGEVTDMDGLSRVFAGFQYGKVGESYTQGEEWPSDYPEAIWDSLSDLTPGTTYNFRTRVSNITDEDTFYVFGETKQFTTLPATEPPVVYTYNTDEITETGALLRGYLGASGGILTAVGFEYGKTTSYGTTLWAGASAAPGYYTEAITSLDPDTLYHTRAIAENDYGTGYGVDKTFTTLAAAVATMHIVLPNANGKLFLSNTIIACDDWAKACTEFRFQIRNDGNVAKSAWYKVSVVGGATLYDSTIASLNPGATSVVIDDTICALPGGLPVGTHTIKVETGPEGLAATDSYTEQLYVIEEPALEPPSGVAIETLHYENRCGAEIADNCVWFNCYVEHFGGANTCTVYAEYKSEGDPGWSQTDPTVVPYDPGYDEGGFQHGPITICIPNCEVNHYIRTVASNDGGAAYSAIQTPITVRLEAPTEITQTSVKLNAYIVSMGSVSTGIANFKYGTPSPNTYDTPHISIYSAGAISRTITGLEPNTTYQYHLFARVTSPQAYPQTISATVSFTTLGVTDPPRVMAQSASGVTQSSTILNANLTYTGGVSTHIGFEYGKTTSYGTTIWDKYTSTTGHYEKGATGLEANTTYHFRPIVTNGDGTGYGADKTFTTLAAAVDTMRIVLPNANGKLFLSNTIIACDNWPKACTEFRFQIRNDGNVAKSAWYKVSVVGGATLYDSTIASLNPGATSVVIDDTICALPGGLPVGTHTIKVETGPEGLAATDSYTEQLYVIEEPVTDPPRVMAQSASGVTPSSAILNANLTYTGGVSTHIGFEYGKTTSYGTTIWDKYTSTTGHYEKGATGLEANTTYHFRPIVTNGDGTGYGADKTFTTLAAAVDTMHIVLPNANGKLFLSNTIIACDNWPKACTEFRFQIRNDGNVAKSAWYKVSVVGGATLYDSTIASLNPGATSVVIDDKICALPGGLPVGTHTIKVETGPEGLAATDSYTEQLYVIEEPVTDPPRVMAQSASGVTPSSAILNANLTYTGGVSTHIGFEYGKTTSYGTTIWDKYTSTTGHYEKGATGLEANTTYHFRPIVTNGDGTGYGADKTFTTLAAAVDTMHIVLPNANGKLFLSNTIIACDNWPKACTEFRFQIRNGGNVAKSAWYKVSVVGGATLYDSTIASLNPGATSVVIDDTICALPGGLPVGTHTIKVETGPEGLAATDSYTEQLYVIEEPVLDPPEVVAMDASGVTPSSAILNANLTYTGGVSTHIGFRYGKTTSYGTTIWDKYTSTTGHYEKGATGLEANTTYHFRPIVTNGDGTGYGADKTFTTLAATYDITFIATAPGISDLHNVDVNDVTDPGSSKYLGET